METTSQSAPRPASIRVDVINPLPIHAEMLADILSTKLPAHIEFRPVTTVGEAFQDGALPSLAVIRDRTGLAEALFDPYAGLPVPKIFIGRPGEIPAGELDARVVDAAREPVLPRIVDSVKEALDLKR